MTNHEMLCKAVNFKSEKLSDFTHSSFQLCNFLRGIITLYLPLKCEACGIGQEGIEVIQKIGDSELTNLKAILFDVKFQRFVDWWFEQEATMYDDDHVYAWWDAETIIENYNRWVKFENCE